MTTRDLFLAGLPDAGKTTFIAALWFLIFSREPDLALGFDSIEDVDLAYLDGLRTQWVQANKLERTRIGSERTAVINLAAPDGSRLRLSLEDFAGEGFRRMWAQRRVSRKIVDQARKSDRHLLLVNIGKVVYPQTADEFRRQLAGLEPGEEVPFDPRKCPTAVQVTDVLQTLLSEMVSASPAKIAVALTAWDEVAREDKTPSAILAERLPLLSQYLAALAGRHEIRLYGVSCQGGSYDAPAERARILDLPPLDRLSLVEDDPKSSTKDLTRMLAWLLD